MNQNLLSRVLEFLRRKMWNKRWQRAVTCLAAVAVFGVTYALVLPAVTMSGPHPELHAEVLTAWTGDELTMHVVAETAAGENEKVHVISMEEEGASLSEKYLFNEEGIAVIQDKDGQEIELHRVLRDNKENVVDYWFVLEEGTRVEFDLELIDEPNEDRFVETIQKVKRSVTSDETATAANAVKSSAVSTASNAAKAAKAATVSDAATAASASNAVLTEKDDDGFEQILDGAIINDLDEEEEEAGIEITAMLKASVGSGRTIEDAEKDADRNADKRGNAQLKFRWKTEAAPEPEMVWSEDGAHIAVFYDDDAEIPKDAVLKVRELKEGTEEYDQYLAQSRDAVIESGDGSRQGVKFARFFDISIIGADGIEIEPAAPVKVVVSYDEAVSIGEGDDLNVLHFKEGEEIQVLTPDTLEGTEAVEAVRFTAQSFSVYGVVGSTYLKDFTMTAEGETFVVTVSGGPDANIPDNAVLEVREVTKANDDYAENYDKAKEAVWGDKDAELEYIRLFDIRIMVDGKEIQPAVPVNVDIQLADNVTNTKDVEFGVAHMKDGKAYVHDAEMKNDGESGAPAIDFTANSFSYWTVFYKYTVDFYYGSRKYSLPGGNSIMLSSLLGKLDLPSESSVKSVKYSDPSQIQVEHVGDDWKLTSLKPFTSDEVLTVVTDENVEYEIRVMDPEVSPTIVDFRVENILSKTMYTAEEAIDGVYDIPLRERWSVDLAKIPNKRITSTTFFSTLTPESREDLPADYQADSFGFYGLQIETDAGKGNPRTNVLVTSIYFDEEDGKTKYTTSKGTFELGEDGQGLAIISLPRKKCILFDPNGADQDVDTGDLFQGKMTVNGTEVAGEHYITYKCTSLTDTRIPYGSGGFGYHTGYKYEVANASDFPTNVHLTGYANSTESGFKYFDPRYATTAPAAAADHVTAANSKYWVVNDKTYGTGTVYGGQKPTVVAIYGRPDGTPRNTAPLWPDENGNYPEIDGKPQGTVAAEKKATWTNADEGIGKITLTVQGTPIKKGSDVVIVLDKSGSMGQRYNWVYTDYEREAQAKIASYNAVNLLLNDPTDNNRVGFTSFYGEEGPKEYLRTSKEKAVLVDYIKRFSANESSTRYHKGLKVAHEVLNSRTDEDKANRKTFVLFLTDGNPNSETANDRQVQKNLLINNDKATIYAIGIAIPGSRETAINHLKEVASSDDKAILINNPDDLDSILQGIANDILAAGKDAQFTDTMSEYFDALTNDELAAYNAEHGTDYANSEGVTVEPSKTVRVDIGTIEPTVKTFEFYIRVNENHVHDVDTMAQYTNDEIDLDYTDPNETAQKKTKEEIGEPLLGRGKSSALIKYYRVDVNGNYVDSRGRIVGEEYKNNALLAQEPVTGIEFDYVSEATFNVHYKMDGKTEAGHDFPNRLMWGVMPQGYVHWDSTIDPAHVGDAPVKQTVVTTDPSNIPVTEFKCYAPYTIHKEVIDRKAEGYKAGEEVHYKLTIHCTAAEAMMSVNVIDDAYVPDGGYDRPAQGTVRFVENENVTWDADSKTFTIKSVPAGGDVTIEYYYTVAEGDVGKQIKNRAYVNGVPSNEETVDTRKVNITKTASAYPQGQNGFRAGDVVTYTITVENLGSKDILNATVSDATKYVTEESGQEVETPFDADLEFVPKQGITYDAAEKMVTIAHFNVKRTDEDIVTFQFKYTVKPEDIGKKIRNIAAIYDEEDQVTSSTEVLKLVIRKIDMTEQKTPLAGAVFQLYKEDKKTKLYENLTSMVDADHDGQLVAADGTYEFTLPTGTYYLVEEKAPGGYDLLVNGVKIVAGNNITAVQDVDGGSQYTVTRDGTDTLLYSLEVTNAETGVEFPSTGGRGTLPYTLCGLMMVVMSALMYGFAAKKF